MKTKEDETSLVLNSISELVVFQDKEHNIKWVNQAAADSVGATRKELIGQKCHKVWHNIDIECEMCPVSIAITTGQPASGEIMDPLGRVFLLSGSPVRDENGNIVGLVEIGNDITVIKQAQQKSQENEIKFREAYNRSNFYKDLFAHDINNIFQNIQSAVDLFTLSIKENNVKKSTEMVDIINEQIIRGSNLVSNVRRLSQIEEEEISLEKVELIEILNNARNSLLKVFQTRTVNIKLESDFEKIYVQANYLLFDLVENILINAIKHNLNPDINILINVTREKEGGINYIKFEFLDNGIGIPNEMKQKIFLRATNSDSKTSGLGLGLTLVKKLIEIYKGKIRVEDRVKDDYSKGSKFILYIPEAI